VNNSKRRNLTREVSRSETRDAEKKAARDDGRKEVRSRCLCCSLHHCIHKFFL